MTATAPVPHFLTWLVPLLLFLGGCAWAVTWFLIRRFIKSVDDLAAQLHGEDGVVAKLRADLLQLRASQAGFHPRSEADMQAAELFKLLEDIRREALAREDRVLAAVRDTAATVGLDVRAVREEVGKVHARVDRILERRA